MRVYTRIEYQLCSGLYVETDSQSVEYQGPVALAKGGGGPSEEQKTLERRQIEELDKLKLKEEAARAAMKRSRRGRASLIRNVGGEAGLP